MGHSRSVITAFAFALAVVLQGCAHTLEIGTFSSISLDSWVFAPAWHGYVYEVRYDIGVTLTSPADGAPVEAPDECDGAHLEPAIGDYVAQQIVAHMNASAKAGTFQQPAATATAMPRM